MPSNLHPPSKDIPTLQKQTSSTPTHASESASSHLRHHLLQVARFVVLFFGFVFVPPIRKVNFYPIDLELFLGNSRPILLFLLDYLHDDESRRKRFRLFRLLRDNRMHEFDLHHVRLISFSDFPD